MNCPHPRQEHEGLTLPCATPGCHEGHKGEWLYTVKRSMYATPVCLRGGDRYRIRGAEETCWHRSKGFAPGSDRIVYRWSPEK